MNKDIFKLYFIAGSQDCLLKGKSQDENLLFILENALKSGITCFQFREKGKYALKDKKKIENLAKKCQELCKKYKVHFFVNDDVELALKIKADGVHVGQDDGDVYKIIKKINGRLKIGLSINTLNQAIKSKDIKEIDYFGVGPIFKTISKDDAKKEVGLSLLKKIKKENISKTIVAIGGINTKNVKKVLKSGVDGVAVISAISMAKDFKKSIEKLKGN